VAFGLSKQTCNTCAAYKEQIAYQQALIDRLLLKMNMKPIADKSLTEPEVVPIDPLADKEVYGE
jgi:hypothetical protein